jgi:hypothetical protein
LNTEHDDDILCLAVHPEGHTVATGEIGPHPKIGTTLFSKSPSHVIKSVFTSTSHND